MPPKDSFVGDTKIWVALKKSIPELLAKSISGRSLPNRHLMPFHIVFIMRQRLSFHRDFFLRQRAGRQV